jgi:hypothetical protein
MHMRSANRHVLVVTCSVFLLGSLCGCPCSCCLPRITTAAASGLHLFGAEYLPRLSPVNASTTPSRAAPHDSGPSGSLASPYS